MKRKGFSISGHPLGQYVLAVLLLQAMLLFLYLTPQGNVSLTLPDAASPPDHPWLGSDVMTYIEPAVAFLQTGEFLRAGEPDMHRTIGYPAFLAAIMLVFGGHWLTAVYIIQPFIFALIFPATAIICRTWFPGSPKAIPFIFWIMLLNGIALAYTGFLLTDMLFSSLLISGLACGLLAIVRVSWAFTFLQLACLGWAAQVRPTLSLLFVTVLCFMLFTAKKNGNSRCTKAWTIIAISVVLIAVAGSGPSIRNYLNHGTFTPTNILANNLARYLAGPVLIQAGEGEQYEIKLLEFKRLKGVEQIYKQREFAVEVIKKYPLLIAYRSLYHLAWNLFEPHWEYLLNAFGSGFSMNDIFDDSGRVQWKIFLALPFWVGYLLIYSACLLFMLKLLIQREYTLLLGIVFFLLPLFASIINGQGARMRLCVEPMVIILAIVYSLGLMEKCASTMKNDCDSSLFKTFTA